MTMQDLVARHAPRSEMVARLASICSRPEVDCYYFGYTPHAGHGLSVRNKSSSARYEIEKRLEVQLGCLDRPFCWNGPKTPRDQYDRRDEAEGRAFLTHRAGLTVLAFWDRSGDKRGASNTAFICPGTLTFAQIVRQARHTWPQIWARFTFPVVQVDERGRAVAT